MKTLLTTILVVVLIVWLLRWVADKLSGSGTKTTTRKNLRTNCCSPGQRSTTTLLKVDEGPRLQQAKSSGPTEVDGPVLVQAGIDDIGQTAMALLDLEPGDEVEITIRVKRSGD